MTLNGKPDTRPPFDRAVAWITRNPLRVILLFVIFFLLADFTRDWKMDGAADRDKFAVLIVVSTFCLLTIAALPRGRQDRTFPKRPRAPFC